MRLTYVCAHAPTSLLGFTHARSYGYKTIRCAYGGEPHLTLCSVPWQLIKPIDPKWRRHWSQYLCNAAGIAHPLTTAQRATPNPSLSNSGARQPDLYTSALQASVANVARTKAPRMKSAAALACGCCASEERPLTFASERCNASASGHTPTVYTRTSARPSGDGRICATVWHKPCESECYKQNTTSSGKREHGQLGEQTRHTASVDWNMRCCQIQAASTALIEASCPLAPGLATAMVTTSRVRL